MASACAVPSKLRETRVNSHGSPRLELKIQLAVLSEEAFFPAQGARGGGTWPILVVHNLAFDEVHNESLRRRKVLAALRLVHEREHDET